MQARLSTGSIVIAILSITFIAGSMFGSVSVAAGDSSKKSKKGSSAIFLPTAFEVQAADAVFVDESDFSDQTAFFTFSRSRTPISVSDPTTGEPIDNLGLNNFAVDQLGSLQDCGLSAPPPAPTSTDGFLEKPFDIAVTNLGNGFYAVDLLPTTSEGCVGNSFAALQIRVFDGIRKGQTAGNGFVFGPFCFSVFGTETNCPTSF